MIRLMLSLFDVKAEVFNQPFFVPTVGVAYRELMDQMKRGGENNPLASHPEDFQLFQLGHFDDESGHCDSSGFPKLLTELGSLSEVK